MFTKARLYSKKRSLAGLQARLAATQEMLRGSTEIPGALVHDMRETRQRIAEIEFDIAAMEKPTNV